MVACRGLLLWVVWSRFRCGWRCGRCGGWKRLVSSRFAAILAVFRSRRQAMFWKQWMSAALLGVVAVGAAAQSKEKAGDKKVVVEGDAGGDGRGAGRGFGD